MRRRGRRSCEGEKRRKKNDRDGSHEVYLVKCLMFGKQNEMFAVLVFSCWIPRPPTYVLEVEDETKKLNIPMVEWGRGGQ